MGKRDSKFVVGGMKVRFLCFLEAVVWQWGAEECACKWPVDTWGLGKL